MEQVRVKVIIDFWVKNSVAGLGWEVIIWVLLVFSLDLHQSQVDHSIILISHESYQTIFFTVTSSPIKNFRSFLKTEFSTFAFLLKRNCNFGLFFRKSFKVFEEKVDSVFYSDQKFYQRLASNKWNSVLDALTKINWARNP